MLGRLRSIVQACDDARTQLPLRTAAALESKAASRDLDPSAMLPYLDEVTAPGAAPSIVVESPSPYKVCQNYRWELAFPEGTQFVTLDFDPRCATAQVEDVVRVYSDFASKHPVHGADYSGPAGGKGWPADKLLVPGRTVLITLSTVTDYVNNPALSRFGVRVVANGHSSYPAELQPV